MVARAAEAAVQRLDPRADVVVNITPVVRDESSLVEQVRSTAGCQGLSVHGIVIHDVRGDLSLSLHVEVPDQLTLGEAHGRAAALEEAIQEEIPVLHGVTTHIEPLGDEAMHRTSAAADSEELRQAVLDLSRQVAGVRECHHIVIHREHNELSVSFHCHADPELPIVKAHGLTMQMEGLLRTQMPELGRVVIHLDALEPVEEPAAAPPASQ